MWRGAQHQLWDWSTIRALEASAHRGCLCLVRDRHGGAAKAVDICGLHVHSGHAHAASIRRAPGGLAVILMG